MIQFPQQEYEYKGTKIERVTNKDGNGFIIAHCSQVACELFNYTNSSQMSAFMFSSHESSLVDASELTVISFF